MVRHPLRTGRPPAQAHPLSTGHLPADKNTTRSALDTCLPNGNDKTTHSSTLALHGKKSSSAPTHLPNGKNTRSSAPAQICTHACQTHVRPLSTGHMPAKFQEHPLSHSQCWMPNGKNSVSSRTRSALTPSSAPAQHWYRLVRTPAQHWTRACQRVTTPTQVHPLSSVRMPAKW